MSKKMSGSDIIHPGKRAEGAQSCEQCGTKRGMPHKRTGETVRLRPFFIDGDSNNCRRDNIVSVCGVCESMLGKLIKRRAA